MAELLVPIGLAGRRNKFRVFDPIRADGRNEDSLWGQFSGQGPAVAQEKGLGRSPFPTRKRHRSQWLYP